jgi:hypothetical protein
MGTPADYPYGGDDWAEVRATVKAELRIKPRSEIVCHTGTRDARWHARFDHPRPRKEFELATPSKVPQDFHTFTEPEQAKILDSGFDPKVIAAIRSGPRDPLEPMARSRLVEQEQWTGAGSRPVQR